MVVLKDVVVVIAFSACTAIATATLGESGAPRPTLDRHCHFLLGGGAGPIHLYLKLVGQELVLFLVGLIHGLLSVGRPAIESALMFIVAGFVIVNWSEHGDRLIKRLSACHGLRGSHAGRCQTAPRCARFHRRAGQNSPWFEHAFFIGCRLGGALSGADQASQKYAWMVLCPKLD